MTDFHIIVRFTLTFSDNFEQERLSGRLCGNKALRTMSKIKGFLVVNVSVHVK